MTGATIPFVGSTASRVLSDLDYTRVSDDAAILCKRQDFPRAFNVLQRRRPDHRRWRFAFQRVAGSSSRALVGPRRGWVVSAIGELLHGVSDTWLRRELALDLRACADQDFQAPGVLPAWTARDLWRLSDEEHVPMAYVTQITDLPRLISQEIDTARVILDARRTAVSHRDTSLELASSLQGDAASCDSDALLLAQIEGHKVASDRWRALARRLMGEGPTGRPGAIAASLR